MGQFEQLYRGKLGKIFVKKSDNSLNYNTKRFLLYDISDFVCFEQPVERGKRTKKGKRDMQGWLDYFVLYKGINFLIEIKHCHEVIRIKNGIKKKTKDIWDKGKEQIASITKNEINDFLKIGTKSIKMVIYIIRIYQNSKNMNDFRGITEENSIEKFKIIISKLNPKWAGVWLLNDELKNLNRFTKIKIS